MKIQRLRTSLLALVVATSTVAGAAAAPILININAQTNDVSNPVTVLLGPGTYAVTPIGIAGGGSYDAWNAWGSYADPGLDCAPDGSGCSVGWLNMYQFESPTLGGPYGYGTADGPGEAYQTAALAFSDAVSSMFTLLAPDLVSFSIQDSPLHDNLGGMSLQIQNINEIAAIPEPATMTLMLTGLAGLRYARRKQQL